jgi:haloalkane dehalogenase
LRLIAPDLLGFGASAKPRRASDHQLAMHVDHVATLLDGLGVERFVAVGQDWGGPIACGAAARLAERVKGLVLGNTAVLAPARPFRSKGFHRFSHLPVLSDLAFRPLVQGDRRSIGPREGAAYAWPFLSPLDRAGPLGLARMVPSSEEHPSTPVMDRIGAYVAGFEGPAALVWGRRDPLLGRGLRRHREALPRASVRESDAGHFSPEEIPELWAAAIREVARS